MPGSFPALCGGNAALRPMQIRTTAQMARRAAVFPGAPAGRDFHCREAFAETVIFAAACARLVQAAVAKLTTAC